MALPYRAHTPALRAARSPLLVLETHTETRQGIHDVCREPQTPDSVSASSTCPHCTFCQNTRASQV